jgi:hypothetical protein
MLQFNLLIKCRRQRSCHIWPWHSGSFFPEIKYVCFLFFTWLSISRLGTLTEHFQNSPSGLGPTFGHRHSGSAGFLSRRLESIQMEQELICVSILEDDLFPGLSESGWRSYATWDMQSKILSPSSNPSRIRWPVVTARKYCRAIGTDIFGNQKDAQIVLCF